MSSLKRLALSWQLTKKVWSFANAVIIWPLNVDAISTNTSAVLAADLVPATLLLLSALVPPLAARTTARPELQVEEVRLVRLRAAPRIRLLAVIPLLKLQLRARVPAFRTPAPIQPLIQIRTQD